MKNKLSKYKEKVILTHIINNQGLKITYVSLYRELATKYNVDENFIRRIHIKSKQHIKKQKFHLKMDAIISLKVKSNPYNLEACFRELSKTYKLPFKYFKNRYYRHIKLKEKIFYIENNGIKLYNVKQIS